MRGAQSQRFGRRLDKVVRFERREVVRDEYGNERGLWRPLLTTRAELQTERARERLEAGRPESRAGGVLRFRDAGETRVITGADEVVIEGRRWRLLGDPVEMGSRSGALEVAVERVD